MAGFYSRCLEALPQSWQRYEETSGKPPKLVPMACRSEAVSCGPRSGPPGDRYETGSALLKRDATPRAESVTPDYLEVIPSIMAEPSLTTLLQQRANRQPGGTVYMGTRLAKLGVGPRQLLVLPDVARRTR
jgi:hypothetical protein